MTGHRAASRPLTDIVVGDLRWRGDGPPRWVEGKGQPWERASRTAAEAAEMRDAGLVRLRRHDATDPAVVGLDERLRACEAATPCGSGACPMCGRAHQRWFVSQSRRLMAGSLLGSPLRMLSLVPDFGRCSWSKLDRFDLAAVKRKTGRVLREVGVTLAFGGIDFSMNVDGPETPATGAVADRTVPYLQAQFVLFWADNATLNRTVLRLRLNESGEIKRPVRITDSDGDNAGLAYALKYEFLRREGYRQTADERTDGRPSRNTRNRPLRGPAWVRLALMLDRLGLGSRVLLIGVKRLHRHRGVRMKVTR